MSGLKDRYGRPLPCDDYPKSYEYGEYKVKVDGEKIEDINSIDLSDGGVSESG